LAAGRLRDGAVVLRQPRETDAHAIAAGCSDPAVARWTNVPSPYTLDDARAWIVLAARQCARGSELALVIVRESEDRVVGGVSLRLRTDPDLHGDIGYWVAASERRQGLGARAVRLLAAHGIDRLGLGRIEIAVSPQNRASLALAHSAGFVPTRVELREFKGTLEEFRIFERRAGPA
jgi:RimJ/RimL family protein N-acetyltransferase